MTFHYTRWPVVAAIALTTTGCGLDAMEGKPSPAQAHQANLAALTIQADEPEAVNVADESAPTPLLAYAEPCQPVFRVTVCVDGVATDWSW